MMAFRILPSIVHQLDRSVTSVQCYTVQCTLDPYNMDNLSIFRDISVKITSNAAQIVFIHEKTCSSNKTIYFPSKEILEVNIGPPQQNITDKNAHWDESTN